MKRFLTFSSLVFFILLSTPGFSQAKPQSAEGQKASQSLQKKTRNKALNKSRAQVTKKREHVVKEAVTALKMTQEALDALNKGNQEKALDDLAMAIGKLELVIARFPELSLVPVAVDISQVDLNSSKKEIQELVQKAKAFLETGEIQKARHILEGLASEVVIRETGIPLGIYPDGIKAVGTLLNQGKLESAKTALAQVLSTLVVTETVLPLPILRATILLEEAEALAEKKDRSDKEQKMLEERLAAARKQVEDAELLGYGTPKEYKVIYEQMAAISAKTAGKKQGKGFFAKLKESLRALRQHSQKPKKKGQKALQNKQ